MSKTDLPFLPATQSEPLASAPPNCAVSPGSAARCPKCNGVGYHVRVRNFDTEDADVWECQSPLCTAYGLLWHTPRPKDALGEMRCALLALVEAEKASRDNFDSNAIERIERAMQRADRVLFPERYSPNTQLATRADEKKI